MELQDLEYFLSVAEWGNFSIAAEKSFISQSALSKRITKLEYELQVRLFIRSKNNVLLTKEGEELLPYARDVIKNSNEFSYQAEIIKNSHVGHLHIGYFGNYEFKFLCSTIQRFSKENPHANLSFQREHHGKLNYLIRAGKFDMVFTVKEGNSSSSSEDFCGWLPIIDCPMCIIVSANHKLAKRDFVTLPDLSHIPQIIVSKNSDAIFHPIIDTVFKEADLECRYAPASPDNTYDALLQVMAGQGYIFSTPFLAQADNHSMKAIPVHAKMPNLQFGLKYRTDRNKDLINAMINIIKGIDPKEYFNLLVDFQ